MPIATFTLAALDCPDPDELGAFYSAITGWRLEVPAWSDPVTDGRRWLELTGGQGARIAFQQIDDYVPPTWPGGAHPAQLHLDFEVEDLEAAESAVLELGAVRAEVQPEPEAFRVYLDPAGHPFCFVRTM